MKLTLIVLSILLFSACKNQNSKSEKSSSDNQYQDLSAVQTEKARSLMENKCYLCHNPESSMDARVGPPMIAIKKHYSKDADDRSAFIKSMWEFVKKPEKSKVKLKGAYERFGLMPYQPYKEEDVKLIAAYMYDYQIESPDWFKGHWKEKKNKKFRQRGKKAKHQKQDSSKSFAKRGKKMAMATKKQLGKNLMKAIQEKGSAHAVEFCNVRAMPITQKMEEKFNAKIQRVSDKNRNPQNEADQEELAHIKKFKLQIENDVEPKPEIVNKNGKVDFYYPIVTNSMCLKCHGKPEKDINRATLAKIDKYYPKDQAVNYSVNEIRGMWHIKFEE